MNRPTEQVTSGGKDFWCEGARLVGTMHERLMSRAMLKHTLGKGQLKKSKEEVEEAISDFERFRRVPGCGWSDEVQAVAAAGFAELQSNVR